MLMIDFEQIRVQSLQTAVAWGYPANPSLPLFDRSAVVRSCDEIVDRMLEMLCLAACAFGLDGQRARAWLDRECKIDTLALEERQFLLIQQGDARRLAQQIEGLWALAWSVGGVSDFCFDRPCAADFVVRLPNVDEGESSSTFRGAARLRPDSEIVAAADLAYCLHWAIRELHLHNAKPPGAIAEYVIVERRHALEWLLSNDAWTDIHLDT